LGCDKLCLVFIIPARKMLLPVSKKIITYKYFMQNEIGIANDASRICETGAVLTVRN
jgi:hypothetical protein